jgi:hypothetical protein
MVANSRGCAEVGTPVCVCAGLPCALECQHLIDFEWYRIAVARGARQAYDRHRADSNDMVQ